MTYSSDVTRLTCRREELVNTIGVLALVVSAALQLDQICAAVQRTPEVGLPFLRVRLHALTPPTCNRSRDVLRNVIL